MRRLLTIASAATIAAAAMLSAGTSGRAATSSHITVSLREMSVSLSASTVPSGEVTFDLANTGTVEHEFVILKTDIPAGALPESLDQPGKAAEVGHVDEQDPVSATGTLTVTLRPGHYILLCNKPGHYAAGMYAAFTVSAPAGISVKKMPLAESAAIDYSLAAKGIEDLDDEDAFFDVDALLTAPGVVVTDADRAAIAAGILPRAVAPDGSLLYSY